MPTDQALFDEERSMVTMSFGDHIEDLRRHLIRALLGLFAGVIVTLIPPLNLGRLVVQELQEPAQRTLAAFHARHATERAAAADVAGSYTPIPARIPAQAFAHAIRQVFPDLPSRTSNSLERRYVELPQELRSSDLIVGVAPILERPDSLIALGPMEPAAIFFKACLVTGLVLSSPWAFYQVWAFVAAGLYRRERMFVYKFLPYSLGLFLAGVFICFFAVLPLTLRFLLEFNVWLGVTPMLRLTDWMSFATILPLIFGLCFQTPLVMLFMAIIGVFRATDYRAKRRVAMLIIVIVAALLTPGPDVSSMLFLSIPMILLYELGILLVGRWGPAVTA
jgi:sec-independent protein translocase protein TatC